MDYKEAYDDICQKLMSAYNTTSFIEVKKAIGQIHPELRESEDERIRKGLIKLLTVASEAYLVESTGIKKDSYLAYLEKRKEQDKCPEYCVRSHCIGCSIYEKEKEKWPISDVFGFKVGDAVRLKDGDGRKHIIKAFKEIEGVHGPNFYHVEFEDNSARDGIYPGEEYPNGYYTQMEKFEEEQKPVEWNKATINGEPIPTENQSVDIPLAEWSEEDSDNLERVDNYLWMLDDYVGDDCAMPQGKTDKIRGNIQGILSPWLKSLPERFNLQSKQEWSEEDEEMRNRCISSIEEAKDNRYYYKETDGDTSYDEEISWLKSLRPSWKPSEEQIDALDEVYKTHGANSACRRVIFGLLNDLKKL